MNDKTESQVKSDKDCLGCKLVGVTTLSSISIYAAYLRHNTPQKDVKSRTFYLVFSGALGIFAVYHGLSWWSICVLF